MNINTCKQITVKKITDIKPYDNNPRFNDKTVEALCKIIPKVGFNVPLFVDKEGVIIKGHARFFAAQRLGMSELPCIISENTEEQNKLDRISDNKISELAEWDLQDLRYELEQIDGFDLTDIGFELPKDDFMETEYAQSDFKEYTEADFQRAKVDILQKNNANANVTEEVFSEPFESSFEKPAAVLVKNGVPQQSETPPSAPVQPVIEKVDRTEDTHNKMFDMENPKTFTPVEDVGEGVKQQWLVTETKKGTIQRYMRAICNCCGEEVIIFLKN